MVDMAVGFILGTGFALVVKSLVNNVVMPALSPIMGGVDFAKMKHVLVEGAAAVKGEDGKVVTKAVEEVSIKYGLFISDAIAFIMLAFVVFIIVKKLMEGMKKKEEEKAAEPAKPPREEVLLEGILEALKSK